MVSIEHLRRVWHADRVRLLLRTPGPVPLGLAYVLLVETNPFSELVVILPDYALRISLGTFSILLTAPSYEAVYCLGCGRVKGVGCLISNDLSGFSTVSFLCKE